MYKTYQFRIKDSSHRNWLCKQANKVNFVWNYCNGASTALWNKQHKWLSKYDSQELVIGSSKEIDLNSAIIQLISHEHSTRRDQFKTSKLRWRTRHRSLGWVPLDTRCVKIHDNYLIVSKRKIRFFNHRSILGIPKTASLNQNSQGKWFVNIVCLVEPKTTVKSNLSLGIDLGLKTLASCSDGTKIENPKILNKYATKLASAQRANKKKLVKALHTKIKNVRKDFLHKESTKLVERCGTIFVGDVSSQKLVKTRMAKSVLDAGWGTFKSMLSYKAVTLGVDFKVVDERWSTVTCSSCGCKTDKISGLSALGVRDWECSSCGSKHDRDINAAKNILNFGYGLISPTREASGVIYEE